MSSPSPHTTHQISTAHPNRWAVFIQELSIINIKSLKPYRHPRNGHWTVQINHGKDASGKRIRKTITGKTKKILEQRIEDYLNNYTADETPSSDLTVGQYLYDWYASKKLDWSPRTQELYLHQIEYHIIPQLGTVLLEELAPLHVQRMVNAIADTGKISTANKCRRLLFSALKQAVRWEMLPRNVVEAVDPIKETPRELDMWERDDAIKFLQYMEGHRLYAAFYVLIASGIRRGELLGLKWSNVTDNGIYIEESLKLVDNAPVLGPVKTKRSRRFVALGQDVLEVLKKHREVQLAELKACGKKHPDTDLVFTTALGTPHDPKNLLRLLHLHAKKAGVPKVSIHSLRHLHVSLLIATGVDVKSISERMGHSSTSFTLDRYGHILSQYQNRTGFTVDQLLKD